ncbi:hypothetical protein FKP32DRAFT_1708437 [Trametes sanguinea]|nr:hypothetical protein FKP32DRAFT_1708437 [Trametes sanguinea]
MSRALQLPTGPQPGWEVDSRGTEEPTLKGISESLVVLQSLRQSRNAWLSTIFPKFSVKARGGRPAEVTPPPHTTKAHGKYDIHIGPHVFSNTAIYEVHYLPPPPTHVADGGHTTHQAPPGSSVPGPSSSGVQTSLSSVAFPTGTYVTPALSSKVAEAAQTDPVLANLLNAVINRTATEQQVKTLGYLIQSLNDVQSLDPPGTGSGDQHPQAEAEMQPSRPFDVILEFQERPSERFILPRGDVVCELAVPKSGSVHGGSDLIITHCLPFPGIANVEQGSDSPNGAVPEVVSFRLSRVSQSLWDLLSAWAGGPEKIEESRIRLSDLAQQAAPRSYLQYRLPEGELLSEIQSSVAPSYTMKPIKPAGADSNRAKRKSVSRRPTVTTTTVMPSPSNSGMPIPKPVPVKRRTQPKIKAFAPPPIACHACGKTDVPLMMGGSQCGRIIVAISSLMTYRILPGMYKRGQACCRHSSGPAKPRRAFAERLHSRLGASSQHSIQRLAQSRLCCCHDGSRRSRYSGSRSSHEHRPSPNSFSTAKRLISRMYRIFSPLYPCRCTLSRRIKIQAQQIP